MKNIREGLRINGWLWSSPELQTWKRLLLFWAYIPYLIYAFLKGFPTLTGVWEPENNTAFENRNYVDYRDLKGESHKDDLRLCIYCGKWKPKSDMSPVVLIDKDVDNDVRFYRECCNGCLKRYR